MSVINEMISSAKTQSELSELVEKELEVTGISDHQHESWGETADRVEANAESMAETNLAKFLRAAESRWFELA
jgi:hypothetical protein